MAEESGRSSDPSSGVSGDPGRSPVEERPLSPDQRWVEPDGTLQNWPAAKQSLERAQAHNEFLQSQIDQGLLWMDPAKAEEAARLCDDEVARIKQLVIDRRRLTERAKFGDNEDGNAASERFAAAGREYLARWREAAVVVANLGQVIRNAGAAAAAADEAGEASMRGLGQ